jgi:hypothetical protein
MTSCATIFNRPHKYVTIHTAEPSKIIHEQDTIETIDNKAHLKVQRKDDFLPVIVIADSLEKSILIEPRNSLMWWANLYNYGIGMLVDMKNPKRWTYPDKVWIAPNEKFGYSKFGQANNKGELYLHLSLPTINRFRMVVENEGTKSKTGVLGITIGLDYYHSKNQFVHLGFSGLFGGSSRHRNPATENSRQNIERESMISEYFSLSNNHKFGQFSVGYGLSFAENTWQYHRYRHSWLFGLPITEERRKKSYRTLGLVFPTYFQFGEYFNLGVVYRPTFFRANATNKFAYEHLISLDFAWKIRVKK